TPASHPGGTILNRLWRLLGVPVASLSARVRRGLGIAAPEARLLAGVPGTHNRVTQRLERIVGCPIRGAGSRLRRALGLDWLECALFEACAEVRKTYKQFMVRQR